MRVPNSAGIDGGGIDNLFAQGTVTVTGTLIAGNSAGDTGGGLANGGTSNLTSVQVISNTATGQTPNFSTGIHGDGGGINNEGTITLTDSTITENQALADGVGPDSGDGGGLFEGSLHVALQGNNTICSNAAVSLSGQPAENDIGGGQQNTAVYCTALTVSPATGVTGSTAPVTATLSYTTFVPATISSCGCAAATPLVVPLSQTVLSLAASDTGTTNPTSSTQTDANGNDATTLSLAGLIPGLYPSGVNAAYSGVFSTTTQGTGFFAITTTTGYTPTQSSASLHVLSLPVPPPVSTPEAPSAVLFALGLSGLVWVGARRRRCSGDTPT